MSRARAAIDCCIIGLAGCEKTSHDSIDKWMHTDKGPDKLKRAFADESIDADLSAHAGVNLVKKGMDPDMLGELDKMSAPRRSEVLAKLAPRLWEIARIQGEMTKPDPQQIAAKDAMFATRKYGDDKVKAAIDGYLLDWYTSGYYEGRAAQGVTQGPTVIRMLGAAATKNLIADINSMIATPTTGAKHVRIGSETLLALAATCTPEGAQKVLEVGSLDRGDTTLPIRTMDALYKAYVANDQLFEICDPAGLAPSRDALVAIAKDDTVPHEVTNDAVDLISVSGRPGCLPPLVALVAAARRELAYRYAATQAALRCGGVKSIDEVIRALPDAPYDAAALGRATWSEIARMSPPDLAAAASRELLDDKGRVQKWVGIEALAALKSKADAPKIEALARDGDKLVGYWGSDTSKPEPTLGQRAAELAASLK